MDLGRVKELFPFLGQLSGKEQDRLISGLVERRAAEGDILNRGGCGGAVPLILSGSMRVFQAGENGRELTLFRACAGDTCLLPLACSFLAQELPVMAQAQEECELLMIPPELYHSILENWPVWKDFVIVTLYQRLGETIRVLEQTAFSSVDRRLAGLLYRLCGGNNGAISATHEQLASELGTVREVVSRLLGELKQRGVLQLGRGRIIILNAEKLHSLM